MNLQIIDFIQGNRRSSKHFQFRLRKAREKY